MPKPRFKVLSIVGTRPEAIKMAPVIHAVEAHPALESVVLSTGQHRELLGQSLATFGVRADVDLELMTHDQTLDDFAELALGEIRRVLAELRPHLVLVQGDTTTACVGAVAAYGQGVPVGHVEAGLRSHDWENPFPEEMNRCAISAVADLHFAPTRRARDALVHEGAEGRILVTGNPVVDALRYVAGDGGWEDPRLDAVDFERCRGVLLTMHRRENHGAEIRSVCAAVRTLVKRFPELEVVFPVHPNPNVLGPVEEELGGVHRVHLLKPASYPDMARLMRRCALILTDSGGITEEAPSFGTPVLILRDVTERPEAVEAGAARIVGTHTQRIVAEATWLLTDEEEYTRMSCAKNPFGDGRSGRRIVREAHRFLQERAGRRKVAGLHA